MAANYTMVATQIYVWMQVYQRQNTRLADHMDEAFGEIKAAGYDSLEGWLAWCDTAGNTRKVGDLLTKHGLKPAGMYHGGDFHDKDAAKTTLETIMQLANNAMNIGCLTVNINPNPIGREKSDEELKTQGVFLNRLGWELKNIGLSLTIHNHDPEIKSNARELRANLANTDPSLVGFCIDLHWIWKGGLDPITLLREVGDRTKSLHLRNSVNGVWDETLGAGEIDYSQVKRVLDEINYTGPLVVELAYEKETVITRSLVENERRAREFVRQTFGV